MGVRVRCFSSNIWKLSRSGRKPQVPRPNPLPVSKNQDFCEQSKMEKLGMCVNSQWGEGRRWQSTQHRPAGVIMLVLMR